MFKGSIPALITPFKNEKVDYSSYEKIIEWSISEGSHGFVPCGTTGESPTLSHEEHKKVVEECIRVVDRRVPVIAGTGSNNTIEAVEFTKHAEDNKADAALVVTPYYNKPNQRGLVEHYTKIAESAEIPQVLYNVPSRTACDILPSSVKVLSQHINIVGIKEAVSDIERIRELIDISKSNDSFKIYSGDDASFLDLLSIGGHGVISVAANVIPKPISNICDAFDQENSEKAEEINKKYNELYDLLFIESNPIPVKWMLSKMGLIKHSVRLPLVNLDKKYEENIMSEMLKLNLI